MLYEVITENETITTSDYVQYVQAETLAKLNFELHNRITSYNVCYTKLLRVSIIFRLRLRS